MSRRQLHALVGHEIDEGIVLGRHGLVHRGDDALIGLRAGDREHVRESVADLLRLGTHAAGDDDLAVLGHGRADRLERLRLGGIEEAAGVDDDEIGAGMALGELVTLGTQRGDDPFGIDERLGAAQRNKGNFRRDGVHRLMAYVQNVRKRRASGHAIGASFEPFQPDLQSKAAQAALPVATGRSGSCVQSVIEPS